MAGAINRTILRERWQRREREAAYKRRINSGKFIAPHREHTHTHTHRVYAVLPAGSDGDDTREILDTLDLYTRPFLASHSLPEVTNQALRRLSNLQAEHRPVANEGTDKISNRVIY